MEYSIRRDAVVAALNRVRKMVDEKGFLLNFPVEVRFTAGDDIPLSTGSGRDNAYIAVHVFKGMKYEPYFREVEAIMSDYDGRPHWGKIHFKTADAKQIDYTSLDAHIECRYWLVKNNQCRVERQSTCNTNALALATRKLMGESFCVVGC